MDKIGRDKTGYQDIDLLTMGHGSQDRTSLSGILKLIRSEQSRFESGIPIEALKISVKNLKPPMDEKTLRKGLDLLQDRGEIFYTDYAKSKILTSGK